MAQAAPGSRSRTRGKPLRTYGKRAAGIDAQGETALKKRRTSDEKSALESETPEAVEADASPTKASATTDDQTITTAKPQTDVRKGSIMNFFKPVPQLVLSAPSPQPEEMESNLSPSPPQSSPPQPSRLERRKPRLLKFRGSSLPLTDTEKLGNDDENWSETDDRKVGGRSNREMGKLRGNLGPLLRNRHESPRNEGSDADRSKRLKAKPSSTVQTTLNISCQAAFSECKLCNTVWNPLHPDDVKFHKKQHAAVLRAKRKLKESEL